MEVLWKFCMEIMCNFFMQDPWIYNVFLKIFPARIHAAYKRLD